MTNYDKVKELLSFYSHQIPQPPYDRAIIMIAKEFGLTTQEVLYIVMSPLLKEEENESQV